MPGPFARVTGSAPLRWVGVRSYSIYLWHPPVLALLADNPIRITTTDGRVITAAVHGGFFAVDSDNVSILAESAELSGEIDVERAQQALERARAAHETRESLRAAAARDDAESDLGLREPGAGAAGEPHVERQQQLRAAAAGDPVDHPDRRLGHPAQALHERDEGTGLGRTGRLLGRQLQDPGDVGVRDEELAVGAAEDHGADAVVLLQQRHEPGEVEEHREVEQVHRVRATEDRLAVGIDRFVGVQGHGAVRLGWNRGRRAWAAIDPRHGATRVIWFIDERPLGARYFEDWTGALSWCERLRAQYWSAGWRLTDDVKTGSLPRKGPDRT